MKTRIDHLRVKIASLAAESRIIRRFESRRSGLDRSALIDHRRGPVRKAARHALLALAFLRGIDYARIERRARVAPDLAIVEKEIASFGACWDQANEGWTDSEARKKEQKERWEAWREAAEQHLGSLVAVGALVILAGWSFAPLLP